MITAHFINVPCGCGAKHRLPVDPTGRIQYLCPSRRSVFTLTLNLLQFQKLLLAKPTEAAVADEGVCIVHKAAAAVHDQQRCEDCGFLIASYRSRLRVSRTLFGKQARAGDFWPAGALVGQTPVWGLYLAQVPMSEGREVRCFMRSALTV